jgi:hypothetical protein
MSSLTLPQLSVRRAAFAVLGLGLLAAAIVASVDHGTWWALATGLIAPDLALLAGAARGLAHGQIHPRGVPIYNVVHRFWGPVALTVVAAFSGGTMVVLGLAWTAHVAIDRCAGYGLRDAGGFQRAA